MSDEPATPEMQEVPITETVLDRAADRSGVDSHEIANALAVLNAALIGRHPQLERDYDYVTVDGTRAYRVPGSVWDSLIDEFDLDGTLGDAVALAHTEQTEQLYINAVGVDDRFEDGQLGIVVGIDTAEEF